MSFLINGHQVVVLTRNPKRELEDRGIEQRKTDYSVPSLAHMLNDCNAVVSTIADFHNPPVATKVHLDILEACKQTKSCKIFLPSEFTSTNNLMLRRWPSGVVVRAVSVVLTVE